MFTASYYKLPVIKTFSHISYLFPALYGSIFTDKPEAAFSNYRTWESLGFAVSFAYSNFLCTDIKLYVTMSMLVIGMICYFIVEYLENKKTKSVVEKVREHTVTITDRNNGISDEKIDSSRTNKALEVSNKDGLHVIFKESSKDVDNVDEVTQF